MTRVIGIWVGLVGPKSEMLIFHSLKYVLRGYSGLLCCFVPHLFIHWYRFCYAVQKIMEEGNHYVDIDDDGEADTTSTYTNVSSVPSGMSSSFK